MWLLVWQKITLSCVCLESIPAEQKGQYDSIHQDDKDGPMRCELEHKIVHVNGLVALYEIFRHPPYGHVIKLHVCGAPRRPGI